jgi:hypothetical protein
MFYSENAKLANGSQTQRKQYKLHLEGKKSHMTTFRIQELESFEWELLRYHLGRPFERIADYRKSMGTAMFLETTAKTSYKGKPKGVNTSCIEKKRLAYDHLPYPGFA